jgi:medium-chain acyl-[acyl-carrier-protein] hydrolase
MPIALWPHTCNASYFHWAGEDGINSRPMSNWVICPTNRSSREVRLFCFPYAGSGASVYRRWAGELDSNIEICWIQYPGRESRIRERPCGSVPDLVAALVDGISEWLDRPFAFYGHSLGGKIAFETIRELRRRGRLQPAHLFVGASQAPQLPWPHPTLHKLGEPQFIEEIQNRYGGVPKQIIDDPELRRLLIGILRTDIRLIETYGYTPEPPLDCPISVFGGEQDRTVDLCALEAWRHQTSSTFGLRTLAGDHFFLNSARQELLNSIGAELSANSITSGRSR